MDIRPTKTRVDYEAALAEIACLFDMTRDTAEGNHLDVLVTLVAADEEQHDPIPLSGPIEAIRRLPAGLGISADVLVQPDRLDQPAA